MKHGRSRHLMVKFLTARACLFMGLSLGLAPAEALALTSGDGKSIVLSGEYQTAGGEATYSLPIAVAPGRAGHQPQLSFEYRSNSGNGPLGVGWHLKGLSSVYRCGKNLAIDGAWGGVNLDASDQYCIDGERLVAVNGKPGGDQTEYRTHINDYRKIVSIGKQGSGPQYFKVWTKSGQVFDYGVSADSRVELPGKSDVYKWSLNKLTDKTRRNAITYTYSEDNAAGTHRLSTVSYVGGSIAINYDSRTDKTFSYLKGSKLNQSYRIKSVTTKNSLGSEYSTYNLSYQQSAGTQRSLLTKIEQCVSGTCSTPVSFSWQSKAKPSFQSEKAIFSDNVAGHKFYDVERDGHLEIVALSTNKRSVYTNNDAKAKLPGSLITYPTRADALCHDLIVADWAGNNKPEYRAFCAWPNKSKGSASELGTLYSYPIGSGKSQLYFDGDIGSSNWSWASKYKFPSDLNGDGKYKLESKCSECNVYDFDGDSRNVEYIKAPSSTTKIEYYRNNSLVQSITNTKLLTIGDINGDGYLDLVTGLEDWVSQKNEPGNVVYRIKVYTFTGSSFVLTSSINISQQGKVIEKTEEWGGRGRIRRYNEYKFTPKKVALADLNNDGYLEIIYHTTAYGNQGGYFSSNRQDSSYLYAIADNNSITDVNSDGWPDNIANKTIKRSIPFAQDKIKSIAEYGVDYAITYKPASDTSVLKQKIAHQYPIQNSTPRRYLVSDVSKTPRGYAKTTYNYVYEGAKSHREGYGFLGFAKVTETENGDVKTVRVTEFENTDPIKSGKIKSITVFKDGKKVSYSKNDYKSIEESNVYQVYANRSESVQYDLHNTSLITKREVIARTLDAFGNVTEEKTTLLGTDEHAGNFTQTIKNEYLSAGSIQSHLIYDVNTFTGVTSATLSSFKAGMQKYCGSDGKAYFKPSDFVILIHGDVSTPIVLEKYNNYYRYDGSSSSTNAFGVTTYTGNLSAISASDFNKVSPKACGGTFVFKNVNSDSDAELSSSSRTVAQLITEVGDRYWQVGALKSTESTITDVQTGLTRTVKNEFEYTSNGLIRSSTTTASDYEAGSTIGLASKFLTKNFSYDSWGNLTEETVSGTNVAERETVTVYDSAGLFVDRMINALGHETDVSFNRDGVLASSTNPQGRKQSYSYDAFNRLKLETLPGAGNTVSYTYTLNGACPHTTSKTVSCSVTKAAAGGEVVTQYDFAGREIRRLHKAFNGQFVVVDTVWDRNGRKVKITRPQFVSKNASAPYVTIAYDALNREIKKSEPASNGGRAEFTTVYHGLTTTVTDARGFQHSTVQNLLGHILQKNEPEGASQSYTYYPDGLLRSSTDSAGNSTIVRYDNLGHRRSLDDPDLGKWTYIYNALGELVEKQDANGVTTTVTYDNLGRKTKQVEGGNTSYWVYDTRLTGELSYFEGYGNRTDYYYNAAGLTEEVAVQIGGEKLSTKYLYDNYERVSREVRPNGADSSALGIVNQLSDKENTLDRLAVEYIYNPHGYMSAVRSPKTYADKAFTDISFREEIKTLLDEAIAQAMQYVVTAEKYATREAFFKNKAAEYQQKTVNIRNLDASSAGLLGSSYRFKQWCDSQGQCYLRPATWVLLHDDISVPLDITLGEAVYQLETSLAGTSGGKRNYNATIHKFTKAEFDKLSLKASDDLILADYDGNGHKDLMSNRDIYAAHADGETREELLFTAEDLAEAARISGQRYKFYTDLASDLVALSERVADLTGLYCDYANQLGGQQIQHATGSRCAKTQQVGQADHLNAIMTESKLAADSADNAAYVYYWQRRDTDAFDHTLAETLGNGLVNTYSHNAATGRPDYIVTHDSNALFNNAVPRITDKGRAERFLHYKYDNHNNVVYRNDSELGITDRYDYDGLDRVTTNRIVLDTPDLHGPDNPDFAAPFHFSYDKLGNITAKTGVGSYSYSQHNAGPHAVTQANGLTYYYDSAGNMVRASAGSTSTPERVIVWSAFNKPVKISRDNHTVEFVYDANHNRYLKKSSDGKQTVYIGNQYERITDTKTGQVQHQHYIYADGKLIALNTQTKNAENQLETKEIRYLHYDALNSVDMITDGYGLLVERRSFDVWGRMRAVQWRDTKRQSLLQDAKTNRGYTGHEHIEEVGLIHMNGRVYDQELGRFLSADPLIQSPYVTGSFNRYTYTLNNPLKFIDPTGFRYVEGSGGSDGLGRSVHIDSSGKEIHFDRNGRNTGSEPKRYKEDDLPSKTESLAEAFKVFKADPTPFGRAVNWLRNETVQFLDPSFVINVISDAWSYAEEEGVFEAIKFATIGIVSNKVKWNKLSTLAEKVTRSVEEFDTVPYRPTNSPLVNHHGVNDVWAKNNIPGYKSRAADNPTMALSVDGHKAAHKAGNDYLRETMGSVQGQAKNLSPRQMHEMAERQFDAAKVPMEARQNFYNDFNQYIYGQ
ncbi:RHS repeat-associated core domain-containing protein [Photobacterium sp. 2_MG-2023]|uniref:RHS repeat-associated core domain-containing protein n=1 Tax=Photobacterium sp. 2_MG-2023 TaxID=3062663 RepID=UPI0026E4628B|nr:RHS repeat-associated core domain-containing protein [Photobacterium sp. 2_MG-2023]MDO6580635.1 RHS repeat-associated core domain-containing protein [Photobacterium sp. 2_MG-2023]